MLLFTIITTSCQAKNIFSLVMKDIRTLYIQFNLLNLRCQNTVTVIFNFFVDSTVFLTNVQRDPGRKWSTVQRPWNCSEVFIGRLQNVNTRTTNFAGVQRLNKPAEGEKKWKGKDRRKKSEGGRHEIASGVSIICIYGSLCPARSQTNSNTIRR